MMKKTINFIFIGIFILILGCESPDKKINKAYKEINNKNFNQAITILTKQERDYPDNCQIKFGLAKAYFGKKRYGLAKRYLLKTLSLDNDNTDANAYLGIIAYEAEDYDRAKEYLSKAVDRGSEVDNIERYLDEINKTEQVDVQQVDFVENSKPKVFLPIDNSDINESLRLVVDSFKNKDFSPSIKHFEDIIVSNPDNYEPYFYLSLLSYGNKEKEKAFSLIVDVQSELLRLIEKDSSADEKLYRYLAMIAVIDEKLDDLKMYTDKIVSLNEDDFWAHIFKTIIYAESEDYTGAISSLEKALQLKNKKAVIDSLSLLFCFIDDNFYKKQKELLVEAVKEFDKDIADMFSSNIDKIGTVEKIYDN